MKKVQQRNQEIFKENCTHVLNGYARATYASIVGLTGILDTFFESQDIFEMTDIQIQKSLIQQKSKLPSIINDIFFVNRNGLALTVHNKTFDFRGQKFYQKAFFEKTELIVSDPFNSFNDNKTVVIVGKTLVDKNNMFFGIKGIEVPLEIITQIISSVHLTDNGELLLLDSTGRFIVASDPSYHLKQYVPADSRFSMYSSSYLAKKKNGFVESISAKGVPVFCFFKPVFNTNWTLLFIEPISNFDQTQKAFTKDQLICSIIVLILFILIYVAEMIFLHFIQKKRNLALKYDSLTGLLTRQRFEREAGIAVRYNKNKKFMLIEADIRGFKFINQNYGGLEADKLIVFFSILLKDFTDQNNGLIGRGYADHFYMIFEIKSVRRSMTVFKKALTTFNQEISGYDFQFFPKFGISFILTKGQKRDKSVIQSLIGQASFAKNAIKDDLTKQYALYNTRLLKKINEERYIENNMEKALLNKEFFVVYQPKINLLTEKIVGAEALVRWNSPTLGLLPPAKFIELFEKNSFVKKLDFYVYDSVFRFLQHRLDNNLPVVPISVNMSRNHSKPEKFMHDFMEIYHKYNIPANLIQVEILERSVLNNNIMLEITELLHKEGFTVAMDDFGSGESSLNMLTQVPVDVLKFDRSFLLASKENGGIDNTTGTFISTLIELSHKLNKDTVFEGVETEKQKEFLKQNNCGVVQGFWYSKPLTVNEFEEYLEKHL